MGLFNTFESFLTSYICSYTHNCLFLMFNLYYVKNLFGFLCFSRAEDGRPEKDSPPFSWLAGWQALSCRQNLSPEKMAAPFWEEVSHSESTRMNAAGGALCRGGCPHTAARSSLGNSWMKTINDSSSGFCFITFADNPSKSCYNIRGWIRVWLVFSVTHQCFMSNDMCGAFLPLFKTCSSLASDTAVGIIFDKILICSAPVISHW